LGDGLSRVVVAARTHGGAETLPRAAADGARRPRLPAARLAGRRRGARARRAAQRARRRLADLLVLRRDARLVALGLVLGARHALSQAAWCTGAGATLAGTAYLDAAPPRLSRGARRGARLLPRRARLRVRRARRRAGPAALLRLLVHARRLCLPDRRVGAPQGGA